MKVKKVEVVRVPEYTYTMIDITRHELEVLELALRSVSLGFPANIITAKELLEVIRSPYG